MPNEFKDRMFEAIERGDATPREAYDYVRDVALDQTDLQRKATKESPEPSPLATYTLQLFGPEGLEMEIGPVGLKAALLEVEENLNSLLPKSGKWYIKIKEWDA